MTVFTTRQRIERALTILDRDIKNPREGLYFVPGAGPSEKYLVNSGSIPSCSCPDYVYRGAESGLLCSHIIAIYMKQLLEGN